MKKYHEILRCHIRECESHKLCVGIKKGSVLSLFWERMNPHNPRALKLLYHGELVGYVCTPEDEDILCTWHRNGNKIWAYVTEVNKQNPTRPMFQIGFKVKLKEQ